MDGPFHVEKAHQDPNKVISPFLPPTFSPQATQGDIDKVDQCYIFERE